MLNDKDIEEMARKRYCPDLESEYDYYRGYKLGAKSARTHYEQENKILRDALEKFRNIPVLGNIANRPDTAEIIDAIHGAWKALKQCDSQNSTDAGAEGNHE